jgi:hypothetical protein
MPRTHSRRRPLTFRPQLEELEGRLVPTNVSRVIDAAGNLQLFVVRTPPGATSGSLTHYNKEGATVWFSSGVTWAQTYLGPSGQFGVNVLLNVPGGNTRWVVYDATGSHDEGTDPALVSVSTAFDPAGQMVLDIVRGGAWFQYDNTGAHQKGPVPLGIIGYPNHIVVESDHVSMASTVIDRTGARTSDFVEYGFYEYYDPLGNFHTSNVGPTWLEFSQSGAVVSKGGTDNGSVLPSFDATGALVYDLVRSNGEWDYFDAQGGHSVGTL